MTDLRRTWIGASALFLLTCALYFPVVDYGFIWDDESYVQENLNLRSLEGLAHIWTSTRATPQYYPLVHTTFWLEYQLWELDPAGYHVTNVLLHALAAVLLWRVLRRLDIPGAWLCAAVFAVHPVNVESAAWITERKNVLALSFYLASALVYLRHALREEAEARGLPGRDYWLALGLFAGALLSKTVAGSLPAALLVVLWWKTGRIEWRRVGELAPWFVLSIGLGLLTVAIERDQVGASGQEWAFNWVERTLIAGRVVWFYAGKLVWPADLSFFYPRWQVDAAQGVQYVYPAAAFFTVAGAWLFRDHIGRAPLAALLLFGGTLFPALGFIDVYPMRFSFVADHFQYLATPALVALGVGGAAYGVERAARSAPWLRAAGAAAAALLIAALSVATHRQLPQYRDLETLWRTTLERNPAAWAASYNLGRDYFDAERYAEAIPLFESALQYREQYEEASTSLALTLSKLGRSREALDQYRYSLRIDPDSVAALTNLARLRASDRDPTLIDLVEAEDLALRARELTPEGDARVLGTLALVYAEQGRLDEAIETGELALAIAEAAKNGETEENVELVTELETRNDFYRLRRMDEGGR